MKRFPLWIAALAVTTLMQATSAFLLSAMTVLGPTLTEAAGVRAERIGDLAALGALGTMVFLAGGGPFLNRFGPVRLLQLGTLVAAGALGLALTGWWPVLLLSSLLVGIGYGPSPPAGSDILHRFAPPGQRSLIFSIKQSAVPLGSALVGLLVPPLAVTYGWRLGLALAAVLAASTILIVQPYHRLIDADRELHCSLPLSTFLSFAILAQPFRAMAFSAALPRLTFVGFALATMQSCLMGFYVTYLVSDIGLALASAGVAFATMQGMGIVGRVLFGWIADRLGSAVHTLRALTLASIGSAFLTGTITPQWPLWAILLAAAATGLAAISWNGIYLAEVARMAPPGWVGETTSGASILTFIGYVLGPASLALLVHYSGSYRLAFGLMAVIPAAALALLWHPGWAQTDDDKLPSDLIK